MGERIEISEEKKHDDCIDLGCPLADGYGWSHYFFDPVKRVFIEDMYCCGSVDICQDYYLGTRILQPEEMLQQFSAHKDITARLLAVLEGQGK